MLDVIRKLRISTERHFPVTSGSSQIASAIVLRFFIYVSWRVEHSHAALALAVLALAHHHHLRL
jgi:hypothetical protein